VAQEEFAAYRQAQLEDESGEPALPKAA